MRYAAMLAGYVFDTPAYAMPAPLMLPLMPPLFADFDISLP